jgi:hypothetical protein
MQFAVVQAVRFKVVEALAAPLAADRSVPDARGDLLVRRTGFHSRLLDRPGQDNFDLLAVETRAGRARREEDRRADPGGGRLGEVRVYLAAVRAGP